MKGQIYSRKMAEKKSERIKTKINFIKWKSHKTLPESAMKFWHNHSLTHSHELKSEECGERQWRAKGTIETTNVLCKINDFSLYALCCVSFVMLCAVLVSLFTFHKCVAEIVWINDEFRSFRSQNNLEILSERNPMHIKPGICVCRFFLRSFINCDDCS